MSVNLLTIAQHVVITFHNQSVKRARGGSVEFEFIALDGRSRQRSYCGVGVCATLWDPVFGTVQRWALDLLIVVILQ